jgi:hypothetical protein
MFYKDLEIVLMTKYKHKLNETGKLQECPTCHWDLGTRSKEGF